MGIVQKSRRILLICTVTFIIGLITGGTGADGRRIFRRDPNRALELVREICLDPSRDRTDRIVCISRALRGHVNTGNVGTYMEALEKLLTEPLTVLHCHDVAHVIGKLGVKETTSASNVLTQCTSLCGDGCFHGVVEGYIARGGELEDAIGTLCTSSDASCYHGLGHGIASIAGDVRESLAMCDRIILQEGQKHCGYGVLMELYEATTTGVELEQLPQDLIGFCDSLPGVYRDVCTSKVGIHEYKRTGEPGAVGVICAKVPNVRECFVNFGATMYWQFQKSAQDIVTICGQVGSVGSGPCMTGAIEESVSIDPAAAIATQLCTMAPSGFRNECYQNLGEKVAAVYRGSEEFNTCGANHNKNTCPNLGIVCPLSEDDPVGFSRCFEGIGRALFRTLDEHGTPALSQALVDCDRLLTEDGGQKTCYNGIMLEYQEVMLASQVENDRLSTLFADSPYIPCSDLSSTYRSFCFTWLPGLWNALLTRDTRRMGDLCVGIDDARSRQECFAGISRVLTHAIRMSSRTVASGCGQMPSGEGVAFCTIEGIRALLSHGNHSAVALCSSLSPDYRVTCETAAEQYRCHVLQFCQ